MADDYESMTVEELQQAAREQKISGRSDMRKEELVGALQGDGGATEERGGSDREPTGDAVKYKQVVTSPDEEPEREGRSLITTDHEVIRQWAEERGAQPATVPGTEHEGRAGVLRLDFPGYGGDNLENISWDQWFETFDARGLNFIYQESRSDGSQSNFFRLENPDREDG
jgi:hypothetical protein